MWVMCLVASDEFGVSTDFHMITSIDSLRYTESEWYAQLEQLGSGGTKCGIQVLEV